MHQGKMKIVYAITSREPKPGNGATTPRKYWHRVGVAFLNRDGSLTVKLEALPVSGELHIRDYVPGREPAPELAPVDPARTTSTRAIA